MFTLLSDVRNGTTASNEDIDKTHDTHPRGREVFFRAFKQVVNLFLGKTVRHDGDSEVDWVAVR
jgi:hypothetical protein